MKTYKPVFKENDLKIQESIKRQYVNSFPEAPAGIPKRAITTCDTHLNSRQPLVYADPKKNPVADIYWDEPVDKLDMIRDYERWYWFFIFVPSTVFFLILWYFWGSLFLV